jgi:hypothetical protein
MSKQIMIIIKDKRIFQAIVLFLVVVAALTPGFYRNQWQTAGKKRFTEWRMNSSHVIVGRLAHSRESGIFASGALLGSVDGGWPTPPNIVEHQYNVYWNNLSYETFYTYNSVVGFQGVLFGIFDKLTDYPEGLNLKLFSGATAILSAITMSLFVVWFFIQFGFLSAMSVFVFILLSEWITLFAGDIYWQLWAFYVPTLMTFYYYEICRNQSNGYLSVLIFFGVLIKILFNGFEFISTALIMIYTPIIYYAVLQQWPLRKFFSASIQIGLSALSATIAGLGILLVQISAIRGGLGPALSYISFTLLRRTYGNADLYPLEADSLNANPISVIQTYISGRAFNLQFLGENTFFSFIHDLNYLAIFVIFATVSIVFLGARFSKHSIFDKKSHALFVAMWFSIISPLSWFILFKGHSYIHTHLNYIIWQMPFTIIGFAFLGFFIRMLFVSKLNINR